MNIVSHPKYLFLLLALGLAGGSGLRAEDKPAAPPEAAPVVQAAPVASPEPPKPEATEPTPAEDKPLHEMVADDSKTEGAVEDEKADKPEKPHSEAPDGHRHRRFRHSGRNNERVSFGSDSTLAAGEVTETVVSILGSSSSAGDVNDEVVSVLGNSRVTGGTVGGGVVSVFGNTYVNAHVRGEVVSVLGNVEFGPDAVVEGEVVCIGGRISRDDKAVLKGDIHNIAIAGHHFNFEGLSTWFHECLLYGRPLAFNHQLAWAWCIALGFLALYTLIALVAPGGVVKCVDTLEQRPGSSLLAALLTLLLTPVAFILLAVTVVLAVGVVLIPAFSLGLFFASLFGKTVMLAWLGRRFTKLLGDSPLAHPVFGVLIGGLIVLGLYTIPIMGFIVYKLLGILGLGVVVYTLILQYKAGRPPKPVKVAAVPVAPATMSATAAAVPAAGPETVPSIAPALAERVAPIVISAATLLRVGFWLRLAATALDLIMIGIITGMSEHLFRVVNFHPGGGFPLWVAVYHVIFWATKGTTIGGIICGLKVVRLDDRPVDWGVAAIRALSAFLSLAVAGIGFIWVAFDDEKQSWHDKIAGTTIVKVPKGTALL
jgi:uncharacterized RDD family membrane protein YckC